MKKNYYIILGLPKNASQNDIKTAYRRLAKEFHPDYYGKNKIPFQKIQEAYATLSHPQKRRAYDQSLGAGTATSVHPAETRRPPRNPGVKIEPLVPDEQGESIYSQHNPEFNQTVRYSHHTFTDRQRIIAMILRMMDSLR